jgi:hypothetical protein
MLAQKSPVEGLSAAARKHEEEETGKASPEKKEWAWVYGFRLLVSVLSRHFSLRLFGIR